MAIVEDRVKPERLSQNDKGARQRWWQFIRPRPELHAAIQGLGKVLIISRVSQYSAFVFLRPDSVFAESIIVFPLKHFSSFCTLQSRSHEAWARFFGSSLKDELRYTPSDCFETFPFPENWSSDASLERSGEAYYQFRADLMVRNDEGLTKTYNRFHDPNEYDPDIAKLRDLHAAMDRAVLDAYGWTDIPTDCEFLLDYEINEEEWGRKKKPYRYRWPDDIHDEVLARLLELNKERAAEERRSGPPRKTPRKGKRATTTGGLF
jgi:hypothetical protein